MRTGRVRFEADRLLSMPQRFVVLLDFRKRQSKLDVCPRVVRIVQQVPTKLVDRLIVTPLLEQQLTAMKMD